MTGRPWVATWLGFVGLALVAVNSALAESEPSIAPPSSFPWAPHWYGGAAGGNPATNCTTVISHSVSARSPGTVAGAVCGVVGQCTGRTSGHLISQPWPAWGDGVYGYARCQKADGTLPGGQWWIWGIKHCPAGFLVNSQGTACYNQSAPHYCKAKEWTLNGAYCERPGKARSWVNRGCGDNCKGNPVNPGNGNKFTFEPVYRGDGAFPIALTLVYNHLGETSPAAWGSRWTGTYHRAIATSPYLEHAQVTRPDGKAITFTRVAGQWTADADITGKLEWTLDAYGFPASWRYTGEGDEVETYDALGRLTSIENRAGLKHTVGYDGGGGIVAVTGPQGRQVTFTYLSIGRVATMKDPGNGTHSFAYGANGQLASVTFPDGRVRVFHYEDGSFPQALTGITDENGDRYATYDYDAEGRAILTELAGGANRYEFAYNPDGSSTVTDPLGAVRIYEFATPFTKLKGTNVQGPACPTCVGEARSVTHDANGFVASRTDWNGNVTTYTHDARGLETSRTEASGTPQARTIATTWHATWRLPTQVSEPGRTTAYTYDAKGNVLTRTLTDTASGRSRTWTYAYTYSATVPGLIEVMTVDGPRTDVADLTTYTYYPADGPGTPPAYRKGDLWKVTNALGQVTEISAYNAHGQPTQITDPNGLVTTLAYDARRRLTARSVGGETTAYDYDGVGQIKWILWPDGSFLEFQYDGAHRLTELTDSLGNTLVYTLDALGNRTREDLYDFDGTLRQSLAREYDTLNRLTRLIGGTNPAGQVTRYAYDDNGNLTGITDPLNRVTANAYDALNRLVTVTDPANGVTAFGHTPLDQLASVTDPRNLITSYALNGLDELTSQLSPDTGTTTNTFDGAGNVLTSTDARGVVTTATYDALNRLSSQTFTPPGGSGIAPVAIGYGYDAGATGKGRLTSLTDPSGSITFTYDVHGRLTQDARLIGGISYTTAYRYNAAGQRDRVTYPSGTVVEFSFDAPGRISGITATPAGGSAQVLVTGAAYHPAGALKGFTHGNGSSYARSVDLDGRISAHTLGAGTRTITWDAASRLSALTGPSPGLDQSLGYDALDRLTDWVSSASSQGYAYDAAGNRTQLTIGASSYPYTVSGTSNRLTQTAGPGGSKSFGYDASGHTTALGLLTFAYDARGRMVEAVNGSLTATYQVNALGQRVVKSLSPGATTHYHYDAEGRLIAESDATGTPEREYVWLDDTPVALITHPDRAVYFLQPDHLDTPRVLTNAANGIVWRWDSDPFGVSPPDPDPDGDSNPFVFNLRLPGQYYDAESGLTYNGARYYDSRTGRFITADPRGINEHVAGYMADLRTGVVNRPPLELNPYARVLNNPLRWNDPTGEAAQAAAGCALGSWAGPIGCGAGATIATLITIGGASALLSGDTPKQCKDDDDFCYKRWEAEDSRCWQWRNLGMRWVKACQTRAADRRNMCVANGGKPNPNEPPEWNPFVDYPR